jgi:hypothetical protein
VVPAITSQEDWLAKPAQGRGLSTYFVKLRIDASQAWQIEAKRQAVNILRPNGLILTLLLGKRFGGIEKRGL